MARDRRPAVARARKVAMYLARELTGQSLPEIGRGFGGRDHSTVLSAVRSIDTEVHRDPELAMTVESLRQRWPTGSARRLDCKNPQPGPPLPSARSALQSQDRHAMNIPTAPTSSLKTG